MRGRGQSRQTVFRLLPRIRPGLLQALQDSTPTPVRPHLVARTFHGKHPVTRHLDPAQDALVLEIRRLHEQEQLAPPRILTHLLALGYDKTLSWVRQTTQYHNRSHLVPAAGAASYLSTPSTTPKATP